MRAWSYLGVGSGKQEKLTGSGTELFRGSRYWGVVMRLPNLKGRIFSGGGGKYSFPTTGCLSSRWILSRAKKDDTDDEIAKYDGEFNPGFGC